MKKRSQERLCILFPPNGTQQAGEGGGKEEGDSHCSSSGEQLEAGGSGEQRVDSCWWLLANELVPFPLPPGAQGARRGKKSVYSADSSKASGVGQALCKAPGGLGVNENSPCCQGSHSQGGTKGERREG